MDEIQLRNFLMICRCASITEAADRLGIAQPSLSQQLLRLEDEFGTKLFRRTSRGVAATDAGRLLQEHAATILRAMNRAREEVHSTDRTPQGDITFAMPSTASLILGVPLLVAARASLPLVNLRIREAMSAAIRRWLEEGRTELAILYDAEGARHLSVKPLARETLLLVGPPGEFGPSDAHGIAANPVEPDVVAKASLILPSVAHGLRRLIDRRSNAGRIELNVAIEMDSLSHIKTLIASGLGFSLLSHAAISGELMRGELSAARVDGLDLDRSVCLVRNPSQTVTRASIEIEDLAVRLLHEMIEDGRWIAEPITEI
jgi:LysR family nitrogen assimilation transcriptional regulator